MFSFTNERKANLPQVPGLLAYKVEKAKKIIAKVPKKPAMRKKPR